MAQIRTAGDLFHRFAFDERVEADRGDGVKVGAWEERFQRRAGIAHLRGGESVMAARLQGSHTQVVFVRTCSQTRQIDTAWRIRDVRTGEVFNIRDITPSDDRQWIDVLGQSGGASG
jgi:head-tail adaptor